MRWNRLRRHEGVLQYSKENGEKKKKRGMGVNLRRETASLFASLGQNRQLSTHYQSIHLTRSKITYFFFLEPLLITRHDINDDSRDMSGYVRKRNAAALGKSNADQHHVIM